MKRFHWIHYFSFFAVALSLVACGKESMTYRFDAYMSHELTSDDVPVTCVFNLDKDNNTFSFAD